MDLCLYIRVYRNEICFWKIETFCSCYIYSEYKNNKECIT